MYTESLTPGSDAARKPSTGELRLVLDSLFASHAFVAEEVGGGTGARQMECDRRIMLNVEQSEVQRVLSEMGGPRWKTALGI